MSRTKIRQDQQIANTRTYSDAYADAHSAGGAKPAFNQADLEHDLNVLRTNMKQLKGSGNFYDMTPSDSTLGGLHQEDSYLRSFVGKDAYGSEMPEYSSNYRVSQADSLQVAVGKLDDGYESHRVELNKLETSLGGMVNDAGDYVARNDAYYINSNSTIDQDLRDLDKQLRDVGLRTSDVQTELNTTQGSIGAALSGDGSWVGFVASDVYLLDSALTITHALDLLDDGYESLRDDLLAVTLQQVYEQDPNGSDAVITTNSTDGAVKIAGDQKLWISATEGLDVDTKADFDVSQFDVDSSSGFSIDASAASNIGVSVGDLSIAAAGTGSDLILSAVDVMNMDAASFDLDASGAFSLNAAANSEVKIDADLVVDAYKSGAKLTLSGEAEVEVNSKLFDVNVAGAVEVNSTSASHFTVAAAGLTLSTTTSGDIDVSAASALDMDAAGAATLDAATISLTTGTGDISFDAQDEILFVDSQLTATVALTRGDHGSTGDWSVGIDEAYGAAVSFANTGIVDAINILGDGYQSLSNEMDAFTLQRAYDQDVGANPDILIASGDKLDFHLADATSAFEISNAGGSNTLKVTDGYVQIDGYLAVTGGTVQINSSVTDSDHFILSPGLSSQVALKLEPSVGPAVYSANLIELYDGYQPDGGALVVRIDEDGDAYFAKSVEIDGVLNVDGSVDADVTSFDVLASGAISLDASDASNFTVSGNTLSFATVGSHELDITSGGDLDMNATGSGSLTAANIDFQATSTDITLTAGHQIEFVDAAIDGEVALTRGANNSVSAWSAGVGEAYGSSATFANLGIVEAINELGDGYQSLSNEMDAFSLQRAYDQDADGSDATITTTSTDGYVVIAGTEGLKVTASKGLMVDYLLDLNGSVDADLSTFALDASSSVTINSSAEISLDAASASNFSTSAGDLTLAAGGSGSDLILTAADVMDMGAASFDLDATGAFTLDSQSFSIDSTAASNMSVTGANLTLSTLTSGTVVVSSAGNVDVDGSSVTIDASAGLSLDAVSASNFSTSAGDLTLAAGGAGSDMILTAADVMDMNAISFDIDASAGIAMDAGTSMAFGAGSSISIDAGTSLTLEASAGDAYMNAIGGDLRLSSAGDGYFDVAGELFFADSRSASTGGPSGAFRLSTANNAYANGDDFSATVRSMAGVSEGAELGLINAINAIAAGSGSAFEKAVWVIAAGDGRLANSGKTLVLDAGSGPNRGSLELGTGSDGYSTSFKPGRDLEVWVNGVLMLQAVSAVAAGSVPADDYCIGLGELNKLVFSFELVEGDIVVVKNNRPAPGEDINTGW